VGPFGQPVFSQPRSGGGDDQRGDRLHVDVAVLGLHVGPAERNGSRAVVRRLASCAAIEAHRPTGHAGHSASYGRSGRY
jgi:hypothetical protein